MNSGITVKKHHELQKFTEKEVRENGAKIFSNADQGIQTAIVSENGSVRTVVGLNGFRYLPDPDPDPADEIMLLALEAARKEHK